MTFGGFIGYVELAYCSTSNFWIKNCQVLDLRYQPIQVSLSFFFSFFLFFSEGAFFTEDHFI